MPGGVPSGGQPKYSSTPGVRGQSSARSGMPSRSVSVLVGVPRVLGGMVMPGPEGSYSTLSELSSVRSSSSGRSVAVVQSGLQGLQVPAEKVPKPSKVYSSTCSQAPQTPSWQ